MTDPEWEKTWACITGCWTIAWTDEKQASFRRVLSKCSADEAIRAIRKWMDTRESIPTPAGITKMIGAGRDSGRPCDRQTQERREYERQFMKKVQNVDNMLAGLKDERLAQLKQKAVESLPEGMQKFMAKADHTKNVYLRSLMVEAMKRSCNRGGR